MPAVTCAGHEPITPFPRSSAEPPQITFQAPSYTLPAKFLLARRVRSSLTADPARFSPRSQQRSCDGRVSAQLVVSSRVP